VGFSDQTARDGMAEGQGRLLTLEIKAGGTDCHGLDERYGGVVILAFRWYTLEVIWVGGTSKIWYRYLRGPLVLCR
jgi:hypothetical protein